MGISAVLTGHCISVGMSWSFTSTIQPFGLEVSLFKASDLMQALITLMQTMYKFTVWCCLSLSPFFFFFYRTCVCCHLQSCCSAKGEVQCIGIAVGALRLGWSVLGGFSLFF